MVDVYLSYDGMPIDGVSIDESSLCFDLGSVGFLRTVFWMRQENFLLRCLFDDGVSECVFDFDENLERVMGLLVEYRSGCLPDFVDSRAELLVGVLEEFVSFDSLSMSVEQRDLWAQSVEDFFRFGHSLQLDGRNPVVNIVW